MVAAAVITYIMHNIRVAPTIRDYKKKYDYINQSEIRNYKRVFIFLGLATMLIINVYGMGKLHSLGVWFFVRLFISIAGGTLVAYVAFLILEYYYLPYFIRSFPNGAICRGWGAGVKKAPC